jgi:hypothetical protein
MNIVRDTVAGSYDCLELDTKAVAKEVAELLKDDRFTLGGPVSTPPFTIPD